MTHKAKVLTKHSQRIDSTLNGACEFFLRRRGSHVSLLIYLSLAVKSKQVHFDSNSLRHCLFNDNEASDMSQYDVVRYVSSSFVRIPYKAVITSFRQTFISHSFKCNSSYARFTLSYLSHPTNLTASERYVGNRSLRNETFV